MRNRPNSIKGRFLTSFKKNIYLGSVVLLFLIVNIVFALQTVSSGSKLSDLEVQEKELLRKNKEISEELVKASSLTSVMEMALALGYDKPNDLIYVRESSTVASKFP